MKLKRIFSLNKEYKDTYNYSFAKHTYSTYRYGSFYISLHRENYTQYNYYILFSLEEVNLDISRFVHHLYQYDNSKYIKTIS